VPAIRPTHTAIDAARATSSDRWYSIIGYRGLYLRARPGLPRTWVFRSVVGGKPKKLVLGEWPEMSLEAARKEMDKLKDLAGDANPIDAKRQRRVAADEASDAEKRAASLRPTIAQLGQRYLGQYVSPGRRSTGKKRSDAEDRRLFARYVEPLLGSLKADEVRSKHVAAMRDAIAAPSEKRKAIAVVRALLSHAKSDGLVEYNVALGIKSPPPGERDRVLTDEELRALWTATPEDVPGVRPAMLDVLRLQLLTAQRAGEVLALRWEDVDFAEHTWFVPAHIAKNGRGNLVPLSDAAFSIIKNQGRLDDYIFPGHRVSPMSSSALA
jgi:integrase